MCTLAGNLKSVEAAKIPSFWSFGRLGRPGGPLLIISRSQWDPDRQDGQRRVARHKARRIHDSETVNLR